MFLKLTFLTIILKTSAIQNQPLNPTPLLAIDTYQSPLAFAVGEPQSGGKDSRPQPHRVPKHDAGGSRSRGPDSRRRRRKASPPKRADREWGAEPRDAKWSAATPVGHRKGDVRT